MFENKTINTSPLSGLTQPDQFIALFDKDRNRLYAYIYAFVTNKAAADDIFQDTSIILWSEFSRFELGTNFSKWANGIAFNRIRIYRRKHKNLLLGLSEELMESITNNSNHSTHNDQSALKLHANAIVNTPRQLDGTLATDMTDNNDVESRWNALQSCCSQLREVDQELYQSFYVKNLKAQEISDQTGRSIFAIRKSIQKIRKKLFDCVDKKNNKASL